VVDAGKVGWVEAGDRSTRWWGWVAPAEGRQQAPAGV